MDKIYNPKSGRYVKKDGKIGKQLVKEEEKKALKKQRRHRRNKTFAVNYLESIAKQALNKEKQKTPKDVIEVVPSDIKRIVKDYVVKGFLEPKDRKPNSENKTFNPNKSEYYYSGVEKYHDPRSYRQKIRANFRWKLIPIEKFVDILQDLYNHRVIEKDTVIEAFIRYYNLKYLDKDKMFLGKKSRSSIVGMILYKINGVFYTNNFPLADEISRGRSTENEVRFHDEFLTGVPIDEWFMKAKKPVVQYTPDIAEKRRVDISTFVRRFIPKTWKLKSS